MKRDTQPFQRRAVLKTVGGVAVASGAYGGVVGAKRSNDLIAVSSSSLELEEDETGEVTVEIHGPPFGRTDVEIVGDVPATPGEFRLSGRGDTQTVELEAVEGVVEFRASLPRGDEQVVTVAVEVEPPVDPGTVLNTTTGETYNTLTAAAQDLNDGDEVLVGAGQYTESKPEVTADDVTIRGVDGPTLTSDWLAANQGLVLSGDDIVVQNLTVRYEANPQGGILADQNVVLVLGSGNELRGVTLDGVSHPSPPHQAGVLIFPGNSVSIADSTIKNNYYGINNQGGSYQTSNVTFEDNNTNVA